MKTSPVTIWAYSSIFIIFVAIYISRIIESTILFANRSPSSLICKMPIKTGVRPMLLTLVLFKLSTLLNSKFQQITVNFNTKFQTEKFFCRSNNLCYIKNITSELYNLYEENIPKKNWKKFFLKQLNKLDEGLTREKPNHQKKNPFRTKMK